MMKVPFFDVNNAEANDSVTEELEELLTVEEVAMLLKVPKSWVYERTIRLSCLRFAWIAPCYLADFSKNVLVLGSCQRRASESNRRVDGSLERVHDSERLHSGHGRLA